jgi:hypothetical protein
MTDVIPDLWPSDIAVDVLPPVAVLRMQADRLGPRTNGILKAEVRTTTGTTDEVAHQLDIVAPTLDNYRRTLLLIRHGADYYPARVQSDGFRKPVPSGMMVANEAGPPERIAASQSDLVDQLREALQSIRIKGLIQSLIARSNERLAAKNGQVGQP